MVGYKELLLETKDGVTWVQLNRPETLNALSILLLRELREAMNEIELDDATRVAVFTASGDRAFCSGIDMREFGKLSQSETMKIRQTLMFPMFREMEVMTKPVIAAINGGTFGGGMELALVADLRIASENATFGLREVKLGMTPSGGACQRLPLVVGMGNAKHLVLTGRTIDASEALRIGLVNAVVPLANLRQNAESLAREIAGNAPLAVRQIKKSMNAGAISSLALAFDAECSSWPFFSHDRAEAMRAFADKRAPQFRGE